LNCSAMLRVGLTGGFASGKSFVGEALAGLGCHLIKADAIGHQVIEPGGEAYGPVLQEFGPGVLNDQGFIDRKKLAKVVFSDPERLAMLNSLVHPAVIRREDELLAGLERSDPGGIVVVEAAIMIEVGTYRRFQRLIVSTCTQEKQIERAMKRDNLTREDVLARIERQMPLWQKETYADYIIDTSGERDDTLTQVREVWESLRSINQ